MTNTLAPIRRRRQLSRRLHCLRDCQPRQEREGALEKLREFLRTGAAHSGR